MRLLREGILTEAQINELEQSQNHLAAEAAERALEAPLPTVEGITAHVYSEDLDPTGAQFDHEHAEAPSVAGGGKAGSAKGGDPRTMADLINACLHDEMRRDPRIVVYGEDVADASREAGAERGKGQGRSLQNHRRPADRVWLGARVQLTAGRGQYCGPGGGLRRARHEAGGGDSVLRLHLAGDAPDSQ